MSSAEPVTEFVVADAVLAGVAARAAAGVPGVLRLEPGVLGYLGHLARSGRHLWTGHQPAPSGGVRIRRAGEWVQVQLDLTVSAGSHVGEVGQVVQRQVSRAVTEQTGVSVDEVIVTVVDIEPGLR